MKERDIVLKQLLQAAQKVGDYLSGFDSEKFLTDSKTQSAVIMQLVVIGELAKALPEDVKKQVDLPWKLMAGFRDLAVHQYFELDLEQVWETATKDVPGVMEKLQTYIEGNS